MTRPSCSGSSATRPRRRGPAAGGAGEHTDYALVTLLAQDDTGGLQIAAPEGWIDAPPIPGTLACNIGDTLDRLTGGWYHSTPHRVRNTGGHDRLSFPFFPDPGFTAEVPPLPHRAAAADDGRQRWDGQTCEPSPAPTATTSWEKPSPSSAATYPDNHRPDQAPPTPAWPTQDHNDGPRSMHRSLRSDEIDRIPTAMFIVTLSCSSQRLPSNCNRDPGA